MVYDSYENKYIKTEATIIGIEQVSTDKYNVIVEYYVKEDDSEMVYIKKINHFTSSMRVGDNMDVFYSIDNPQEIHYKNYLVSYILWGLGSVYFLIASIILLINLYKIKQIKILKSKGHKMICTVVSINESNHLKVNNEYLFYLLCEYINEFTSERKIFKSENTLYKKLNNTSIGMKVKVYVSQNNSKKYYVDIDSAYTDSEL